MTPHPSHQAESWHLDKKVPIALIVMLALHLGGSVWFFRGVVADGAETQRRVAALEQAKARERSSERLAVVESQVNDIKQQGAETKAAVLRVEAYLQRLADRRP